MDARSPESLWLRWVAANSIAELLGLGLTFAVGIAAFSGLSQIPGWIGAALTVFAATATGAIEGVIVGWFQWTVIKTVFSGLTLRSWVLATVAGALAAWFLGSLPAALMGLAAGPTDLAMAEPPASLVALLAAGMGLFLGFVLGLPQWVALARIRPRVGIWIPANMVAWAVGMPLIFSAVDLAVEAGSPVRSVTTMAVALAVTGAAVGAIHGLALVRLAARPTSE